MLSLPRILLIDDDEDDRYLMVDALKSTGIDVQIIEVPNGMDALEILGTITPSPSFIVVDMNMPGMNGIETIRKIRSSYPGIAVVLLTTSLTGEMAIDAMAIGANGCYNKPFTFLDFCSLASQLCRRFLDS